MNIPALIMVTLMALLIFGFLGAHSGMFPPEFLLYAVIGAATIVGIASIVNIILLVKQELADRKFPDKG